MPLAAPAMYFGARHEERTIGRVFHRVRQRCIEARPAGAALELGVGREQREVAAGTGKNAPVLFVVERARAGALGTGLAQHQLLAGGEALTPLDVGEFAPVDRFGRRHRFCLTHPVRGNQHAERNTGRQQGSSVDHVNLLPWVRYARCRRPILARSAAWPRRCQYSRRWWIRPGTLPKSASVRQKQPPASVGTACPGPGLGNGAICAAAEPRWPKTKPRRRWRIRTFQNTWRSSHIRSGRPEYSISHHRSITLKRAEAAKCP